MYEFGDLGKDYRHFVMTTTMAICQYHLLGASERILGWCDKSKFYNSTEEESMWVPKGITISNVRTITASKVKCN